jgi:hypothetical protein
VVMYSNASAPAKEDGHLAVAVGLVEAAGQLFHPFRGGLDYAFIPLPGCGACYPFPDPSAGPSGCPDRPVYESLQGRPEVGPLPTPRRCHAALLAAAGFADVSPVVTLPLRAEATNLIEPASASPRQSGLHA